MVVGDCSPCDPIRGRRDDEENCKEVIQTWPQETTDILQHKTWDVESQMIALMKFDITNNKLIRLFIYFIYFFKDIKLNQFTLLFKASISCIIVSIFLRRFSFSALYSSLSSLSFFCCSITKNWFSMDIIFLTSSILKSSFSVFFFNYESSFFSNIFWWMNERKMPI